MHKVPTWQEVKAASWSSNRRVWVRVSAANPELWQRELIMDVHFARADRKQDSCVALVTGGHGPTHISRLTFEDPPVHRQAGSWGQVCRAVQFYRLFNAREAHSENP